MTYRRGSNGPGVVHIQEVLQRKGYYLGPADGLFGGGTESAVKSFQAAEGLQVDGVVGSLTWQRLFPGAAMPAVDMTALPASHRCLALTGAFETGCGIPECFAGLTGDFDGQGISLGVLQWNIGQGSLQPLLLGMLGDHRDVAATVFHEYLPVLESVLASSREEQLAWARSVQNPRRAEIIEPWRGLLKSLARTPEFQAIEARAAASLFDLARAMCADYRLGTERGLALMFDILTQNGSIGGPVRAQIFKDYARLDDQVAPDALEVARMRIVANRRAAAAKPEYVEDVRARKLTIAEGTGVVHGIYYDLGEYGLRLQKPVS